MTRIITVTIADTMAIALALIWAAIWFVCGMILFAFIMVLAFLEAGIRQPKETEDFVKGVWAELWRGHKPGP